MYQNDIKTLALEILKDTPVQAKVEKAFAIFEKVQTASIFLENINSEEELTIIKIGTVLSLNLFGILLEGKKPQELTQEDWKGIAAEVIDKAVVMDGQSYSVYVFDLYAIYIKHSASKLESQVPDDKRRRQVYELKSLAEELQKKKQDLSDGVIDEVKYTEDCLWISLDAMIKCISSHISCATGEEFGQMIQSVSILAFEYGRLVLYRKEHALLEEYIQNQYELDDQLQVKFNAFKRELDEEAQRFRILVDNAFEPGFRESLKGSIELARAAGVKEEEILKNTNDVDDYFLN